MSFGGLLFTNLGKNLQAKSIIGSELRFTKIVIGDGELGSSSILDLRNVVHEIKSLEIIKLKSTPDGKAILGTKFDNNTIPVGFYWREIGVFAMDPDIGEILYCYGNAGTNADYIPASGGAQVIEKVIDLPIIIGNATNVTATIASGVYVLVEDFENEVNSINTEIVALREQNNSLATNKADLVNGKIPSIQVPIIEVPVQSVNSKTGAVVLTKTDIGLGNVDNSADSAKVVLSATKLATPRAINGVNFDGTAPITIADSTKAPTSHAVTAATYGVGTTANYGHVKTINALTQTSHVDGTALSAYQGYLLKNLIDTKGSKFNLIRTVSGSMAENFDIPLTESDFTSYDEFLFVIRGTISCTAPSSGAQYINIGLGTNTSTITLGIMNFYIQATRPISSRNVLGQSLGFNYGDYTENGVWYKVIRLIGGSYSIASNNIHFVKYHRTDLMTASGTIYLDIYARNIK